VEDEENHSEETARPYSIGCTPNFQLWLTCELSEGQGSALNDELDVLVSKPMHCIKTFPRNISTEVFRLDFCLAAGCLL
jgi:hypothetical protein